MSNWVVFDDVTAVYNNAHKKTCTWNVFSNGRVFLLGVIKWYAPWRQYCFYPAGDTLYNAECLNDIAQFCKDNRETRNKVVLDIPKHHNDAKFGTVPIFPTDIENGLIAHE